MSKKVLNQVSGKSGEDHQKDHGYLVGDEAILQEEIAFIANVTGDPETSLRVTIRSRVSLMIVILDFLKETNR